MENILDLKSQWETFKTENPKVRIRDAAKELGTTEAELIATAVGDTATRLTDQFQDILKEVENLGYVMALTRNDYCVHERKGIYKKVSFNGSMGLAVNPDIDLRLFMGQWKFGFAVNEQGRKSLQFFGKDGIAVHKIYLTDSSNTEAYDELVQTYTAEKQLTALEIDLTKKETVEKPDTDVDAEAFRNGWLALKDTHDFHGLLRSYGLNRTQALRLAPVGYATQITLPSLKAILSKISESDLEIMVFVSSAGCIQIHTGLIKKQVEMGPWFNVLDPEFNMHLREDGIANIWLVKKPTDDGIITSIEVFDEKGDIIVQFFGKRKPGIPENETWRMIANELAKMI